MTKERLGCLPSSLLPILVRTLDQVLVDRLGLVFAQHVVERRLAALRALAAEDDIEELAVGLRRHVAQVLHPAARLRAVAGRAVFGVELFALGHLFRRAGELGRRAELG